MQPAAARLQPARVGEMVQRDHRGDAAAPHRLEQFAVALDRAIVEVALAWLDPAPLDREAVGVVAERRRAIQVTFGVAPPATGLAGAVAVPDPAGLLLPVPPLV